MLSLSLGIAWLLLAPLCLWLLVKGSNSERAGAIVTLALLEAGTITMNSLHPVVPVSPAAAQSVPAHARDVLPDSCVERAPVPTSARVGEGLVLIWPAVPRECATAEVTLRARGRELLVWLHESPRLGEHRAALTMRHRNVLLLPVHVRNGTASLEIPLPEKSDYILTDGRSGRHIPA